MQRLVVLLVGQFLVLLTCALGLRCLTKLSQDFCHRLLVGMLDCQQGVENWHSKFFGNHEPNRETTRLKMAYAGRIAWVRSIPPHAQHLLFVVPSPPSNREPAIVKHDEIKRELLLLNIFRFNRSLSWRLNSCRTSGSSTVSTVFGITELPKFKQ